MSGYVTVWIAVGTPEIGLWCDRCMLPARVRVPLHQVSEDGFTPFGVYDVCTECDGIDLGGA